MRGRSALEEVKAGAGRVSMLAEKLKDYERRLEDSAVNPIDDDEMTKLLEDYGEAQMEFVSRGGYDLDSRAKEILTGLGIGPSDYDRGVEQFSGGWKMRIALAKILALQPDVLLMDEPTNHLDLESIIWLEDWLKTYKGALVMTSHDREFMNRLVSRIVEVANKAITVYSGNYDFYQRERRIRMDQLLAEARKQDEMLAKEEEFIARFKARASHAAQVQSRVKKLEKIERVEPPKRREAVAFDFPPAPRSGDDVAMLKGVSKSYGARSIYDGFDFSIRRRERWCIMGVNGAGKSTLLKLIAGASDPDAGSVTIGGSVKMGYFAQHAMELLDGDRTVFESLEDSFPQAGQGSLRALAGCFGFSGDDVEKKCRVLSGGEKARLVMAKMLYDPPNFLVLDEPTNHLDMMTKEMLIKALAEYDGTMLFVSHDRHFLAALSNRVLELTPDGIHQYGGGYTEYVARTGQEAPGLRS
jgi:ATPase subunit of ABC transporter with duplicated ATPase domains